MVIRQLLRASFVGEAHLDREPDRVPVAKECLCIYGNDDRIVTAYMVELNR